MISEKPKIPQVLCAYSMNCHDPMIKPVWCLTMTYAAAKFPPGAWISNYIHYNVWDEITYPFLNFNGATIGWGNDLSLYRHQAITWTNDDLLSMEPSEINLPGKWNLNQNMPVIQADGSHFPQTTICYNKQQIKFVSATQLFSDFCDVFQKYFLFR